MDQSLSRFNERIVRMIARKVAVMQQEREQLARNEKNIKLLAKKLKVKLT